MPPFFNSSNTRFDYNSTAVHDAVQVISYFNYINRIADALDVDLEHDIVSWEQ